MDARVEFVIKKIEASSGHACLPLRSFSRQLGISDRRLSDLFRRFTGLSFCAYMRRVRLQRATHLLRSAPSLSIKEIVSRSGYQWTSSLDRDCRKTYGVSPNEIRKGAAIPDLPEILYQSDSEHIAT